MLSDFTGGPVQLYLSVFNNGWIFAKMARSDAQRVSVRYLARRRLERKVPEMRLSIDGVTYLH